MRTIADTELRDQVEYANQWGDPKTWHGRGMYVSPEDLARGIQETWVDFCAAIGATLAEVERSPDKFGNGDARDLRALLLWAIRHTPR